MARRYDNTETVASLRRIDTNGNDYYYPDCVAGIQCQKQDTLQIDLRNLRSIRVNSGDSLVVEIPTSEVLACIADTLKEVVKN